MKHKQPIIFLMVSVLLTGCALYIFNGLSSYVDNSYLGLTKQVISKSDMDKILLSNEKTHVPLKLLFISNQEETISNQNLYQDVKSNLIALSGDKTLFGQNLINLELGESTRCLVSRSVARKLFGSLDIKNKVVSIKGQTYVISDILPAKVQNNVVVLNFSSQLSLTPDTLVIKPADQNRSEAVLSNQLKVTYGLSGNLLPFKVLGLIFQTMLWVLLGYQCFILCKLIDMYLLSFSCVISDKKLFGLLFSFAWGILMCHIISIPSDFIPNTAWSDFSFFSKLFTSQRDLLDKFFKSLKGYLDVIYLYQIGKILILLVCSIVVLLWSKISYLKFKCSRLSSVSKNDNY